GGLGVAQRLPCFDQPLPCQITTALLEHLGKNVGGSIAEQVIDVRSALGQGSVFFNELAPIARNRRVLLGRKIWSVEITPYVLCIFHSDDGNDRIVDRRAVEHIVHIGQPFLRRLLDGEPGLREAAKDQDELNPTAGGGNRPEGE